MVAATASWPSRHTVARTGTTSPTTALAGYLPPETTGWTSSIPIRPTTTHPVRLARRGAAWCCTADRSGRALLSGLVYSLIAPYTHRSGHAIPTGSKTSLRRSRRRGQATGQWPAASAPSAGQSLGSAGRGARQRSLGAGRAGSGGAATQSGRAAEGCRECGQRAVEAVLVGANEVRYRRGRSSSGRPLRRRAAGYNRPTGPAPQPARCGAFPVLVERNDDCTGTLKSASSGFSTPTATSRSSTDTAQWSRPDLCLVAGLGWGWWRSRSGRYLVAVIVARRWADVTTRSRCCGWGRARRGRGPPPARTCTP